MKLTFFGRGQLQGGQNVSPHFLEKPCCQCLLMKLPKRSDGVVVAKRMESGCETRPGCEMRVHMDSDVRTACESCCIDWGFGAGGPAEASLSANVTTRCESFIFYR